MVIGQHQPVPICCDADQRHPEPWLTGKVANRDVLGGAHPLDLRLDVALTVRAGAEVDVAPGRHRVGGDDLHRLVEAVAEPRHQVGMPVDHGLHRLVQPVGIKLTAQRELHLHRIHVVAALHCAGVEEQSLL